MLVQEAPVDVDNELQVHCEKGSDNGIIANNDTIYLTNNQAILIDDNGMEIFE